jgi:hypothetical protein
MRYMFPSDVTEAVTKIRWNEDFDLDKEHIMLNLRISNVRTSAFRGDLFARLEFPYKSFEVDPRVLSVYFLDAGQGSYEQAFPDLMNEAKGLDTMPIDQVVSRLKDKQGKGEQDIEVIGLKLPSEEVNGWGIVLLLSVQFYFWLHLHELNRKIDATSPGWDVAWIGMYGSLPAVVTMWISVGVLPMAAVALLALNNPLLGDKHIYTSRILVGLIVLASLTLVVSTMERLRVLKMLRPAPPADQLLPGIPSPS